MLGAVPNMHRKIWALCLVPLLVCCFILFQAFGTIGVSTLGVWVTIPAGKTVSGTFTFTNYRDTERRLLIKLCDWKRLESGEIVLMEPGKGKNSLTSYIEVQPRKASLQAGESRKFRYKVTMPDDTEGALWGGVLAVPEQDLAGRADLIQTGQTGKDQTQVSMNKLASYGFTIKIWAIEPSTAKPSARISSFQVINEDEASRSFKFKVMFLNNGNIPLRPEGHISLFDSTGQRMAHYEIDRFGILPDSVRVIKLPQAPVDLPLGNVKAQVVLQYEADKVVEKQVDFTVGE